MQQQKTLQWPAYLIFSGLVCILLGIVGLVVTQKYSSMVQISNAIGYLGLVLVLVGFLIHISLDWP